MAHQRRAVLAATAVVQLLGALHRRCRHCGALVLECRPTRWRRKRWRGRGRFRVSRLCWQRRPLCSADKLAVGAGNGGHSFFGSGGTAPFAWGSTSSLVPLARAMVAAAAAALFITLRLVHTVAQARLVAFSLRSFAHHDLLSHKTRRCHQSRAVRCANAG